MVSLSWCKSIFKTTQVFKKSSCKSYIMKKNLHGSQILWHQNQYLLISFVSMNFVNTIVSSHLPSDPLRCLQQKMKHLAQQTLYRRDSGKSEFSSPSNSTLIFFKKNISRTSDLFMLGTLLVDHTLFYEINCRFKIKSLQQK